MSVISKRFVGSFKRPRELQAEDLKPTPKSKIITAQE